MTALARIPRCWNCDQIQARPAPRKHANANGCADPATCWQWDHTCYAQRMRRGRAMRSGSYAPATMGGQVVPQERIAA